MNAQPTPTNEKQFLHQYTPGAMLPFTQAIITALIVFVSVWVILWIVFDVIDPHKPALILAVLAMLIMWISRMNMWKYLATLEQITGIDINNDGSIGEENTTNEPPHDTIRITLNRIKPDGHYQSNTFDMPATRAQLAQLATGLLTLQKPFTEKEWSGPGKPFAANQFRTLRSTMRVQGLIEPVNEKDLRQGLKLTEEGELWLENYLPSSPPPPSEMDAEE